MKLATTEQYTTHTDYTRYVEPLGDQDPATVQVAISELLKVSSKEIVQLLVESMGQQNMKIKLNAGKALIAMGPAIVPWLLGEDLIVPVSLLHYIQSFKEPFHDAVQSYKKGLLGHRLWVIGKMGMPALEAIKSAPMDMVNRGINDAMDAKDSEGIRLWMSHPQVDIKQWESKRIELFVNKAIENNRLYLLSYVVRNLPGGEQKNEVQDQIAKKQVNLQPLMAAEDKWVQKWSFPELWQMTLGEDTNKKFNRECMIGLWKLEDWATKWNKTGLPLVCKDLLQSFSQAPLFLPGDVTIRVMSHVCTPALDYASTSLLLKSMCYRQEVGCNTEAAPITFIERLAAENVLTTTSKGDVA